MGQCCISISPHIPVSIHTRNDCGGDIATDEGSDTEKATMLRPAAHQMTVTLRQAVALVCLTSLSTRKSQLLSLNLAIVAVKRFSIYASLSLLEESALLSSHKYGRIFGQNVFSFKYLNDLAAFMTAFAKVSLSPTGGIFSVDTARIIGLAISTMANFSFISTTFLVVQESTEHVKTWLSTVLATAPNRISGGVLTSPELKAFEAYQDVLKSFCCTDCSPILLSTRNLPLAVAALVSVVASLILSCLHLIILGDTMLILVGSDDSGLFVLRALNVPGVVICAAVRSDGVWCCDFYVRDAVGRKEQTLMRMKSTSSQILMLLNNSAVVALFLGM
ncbi:hypothetical protein EGR_11110 [Echinococcus granulosus]|uniref:Uncharacterized protein n=1 Tax=Echinococcus granulosus TaxID=6210 RepID=W6TZ83_ECHGR|nr:hypothetical protein EGR_11110 [Echinococcus granulosus]EUB54033.1 hypothetical protein EGR_11110 [Echinococcus granulosus]